VAQAACQHSQRDGLGYTATFIHPPVPGCVLRTDFSYELPEELIAQEPPAQRSAGRLLLLAGACAEHRAIADLPRILRAGDLLVFNDTRVIRARLSGTKDSGGQVEVLVDRLLDSHAVLAQVRASKPLKPGRFIALDGAGEALLLMVGERHGELYEIAFPRPVLDVLEQHGQVPLPPYIRRPPDAADDERYQTVFARHAGAVAAPTAGLHFDAPLLAGLEAAGVASTSVTLHVGSGTFTPVRSEDPRQHTLHAEWCDVGAGAVAAIAATQAAGGRVVAVGTTVMRALETAAQHGALQPFRGETRLYVLPGHRFRVADLLLTNFHLPESTLLMLACAFGGHARVLAAYAEAVRLRYRFFSYGDAMLLSPAPAAA
jgi:S-adenosylmethionine:tRNA ribosyltransferase-isomerase